MSTIKKETHPDALITFGTTMASELYGAVKISLVVTDVGIPDAEGMDYFQTKPAEPSLLRQIFRDFF